MTTIATPTVPTTPSTTAPNDVPTPPVQVSPPVVPSAPAPAPTPALPVQAELVSEAVERARKEEKARLRKELEDSNKAKEAAESRTRELEASLKAARTQTPPTEGAPAPDHALQSQLSEMQRQVTESNARVTALLETQALERVQAETRLYREAVLREKAVPVVVAHYVRGNTAEEIDASAAIALAEYHQLRNHFVNEFASQAPVAPAPAQMPQVIAMPVATPGAPQPFPSAPSPAPAPSGASAQGLTPEQFAYLTSQEAARNGDYTKHRGAVMAYMQNGGRPSATTIPMRPFAAAPMAMVQQPTPPNPYQTTAPLPQQQYVQAPGGVQQPMGLPMAPAHAPQSYQSPVVAPAPGQPQMGAGGMDLAALRAQAAQSAHNALGNPGSVSTEGIRAPRPQAGYGNQPLPTSQLPSAQALQSGGNPMARNG